ncbi:MAG TPA: response regulator, partial [Ktedonobacterales bacterium]
LHLITEEHPHLVLLDIEMPQLDGYGLLSILRGQRQFSSIPVAILTSRAADIHRQHAMDLGANAYLVKPCPHDILLQTVAELADQP